MNVYFTHLSQMIISTYAVNYLWLFLFIYQDFARNGLSCSFRWIHDEMDPSAYDEVEYQLNPNYSQGFVLECLFFRT